MNNTDAASTPPPIASAAYRPEVLASLPVFVCSLTAGDEKEKLKFLYSGLIDCTFILNKKIRLLLHYNYLNCNSKNGFRKSNERNEISNYNF